MGRLLQARIDSTALVHNLQRIRQLAPGKFVLAMVKANAYGHGLEAVAKTLSAADALGVACIEEALQLRNAGVRNRIVLCEGFFSPDELTAIATEQLEIVVHNNFQLEILEHSQVALKIWVKIDTGMNRLGFRPEEISAVFARLAQAQHLIIVGIMTHFANADDLQDQKTTQQVELFKRVIKTLPTYPVSMANSAAILAWPTTHGDWIRPGIMLYGVSPFASRTGEEFGLRQVMTLETNIIAIKTVYKGETIGYSSRFVCPENMLMGVIAIGYGDGYTAKIPDGTPVLVNSRQAKIVGRVSMDMAMIDLRHHHNAKIGDKVTLWGSGLPVEEIANYTGIMAYELLTSLGTRVVRNHGADHSGPNWNSSLVK